MTLPFKPIIGNTSVFLMLESPYGNYPIVADVIRITHENELAAVGPNLSQLLKPRTLRNVRVHVDEDPVMYAFIAHILDVMPTGIDDMEVATFQVVGPMEVLEVTPIST